MRRSILISVGATRPEAAVPFAELVRWTAADRLWFGQGVALGAEQVAAWLAGLGLRVPVGMGVSVMPLRSPYAAALEARSVAIATGQPVVAGFGPGSPAMQAGVLGRPYASPLTASREYLQAVRALLDGAGADAAGATEGDGAQAAEYYPASGLPLHPVPAPPVELALGVLRPKMAKVAGEIADAAVCWLSPAEHLARTIVPAIRGAARQLERPARTVAYVPFALARKGRDPLREAAAACSRHAQQPHYRDALRHAGITFGTSREEDAMRTLIERQVFLYGDADEVRGGLESYREAGVDEVVLNAVGVGQLHGPAAAADDLLRVIGETPQRTEDP